MVRIPVVAALLCLPLLTSCATSHSEAPLATNFSTAHQLKLQAASHWNTIAKDVAKQISASLKEMHPLYVNQSSVKTVFDRAFANQLTSALLAEGHTVLKTPAGALSVEVDTQTIRFSADRPRNTYVGLPAVGLPTALAAGVWALRNVQINTIPPVLGAVAVGFDAHTWFSSEFASGGTPQTEIIVTTSISDENQYLAHSTSIYYVADSDSRMYVYEPPIPPFQAQTRNVGVTGQ